MRGKTNPIVSAASVIQNIELAIAFALLVVVFGPRIFGFQTYCVMSGSMEPTYHVGALVFVDITPQASDMRIDDPIAFTVSGKTVIHRIVEIDSTNRCFSTKGDANELPDPSSVLFENALGIARVSIPGLGAFLMAVDSNKPAVLAVAVIFNGALCILSWLAKRKRKPIGKKKGYPA